MKLLVVESPAKAKTISRYLSKEFQVKASVGHVRDLPKSNKNAIDIEAGFVPHYEILKDKASVVAELKQAAKKASVILLATDPDREGEAIAWHVVEACGFKPSETKRVVFHEITKEAVAEALKHPRAIDLRLKTAQEARRVLDRLFGYDLSELIWRKVRYGLSAGRVQSPALRILVEREREIRAFVPEKFWVIDASFETKSKQTLAATAAIQPKTEEEAEKIVALAKESSWRVAKVEKTEALRKPRPPFTTSTLQQAASSRFGFSPSQTMRLAQGLYEAGKITYMRTDSQNLNQAAVGEISKIIGEKYGNEYALKRTYKSKSKNIQEAHEAIRPTHASETEAGKNPREKKLYQLIWSRTIASQMADAKLQKTKVEIEVYPAAGLSADKAGGASKKIPLFVASGSVITFDGWLLADPASRSEENELPSTSEGEPLKLLEINSEGKQTEPPRRYSEAGLVKELEKRGIGRPSTYAPIIQTLSSRGYTEKEGRSLRPTETGEVVDDFLEEHFAQYISDSFTSQLEDDLDKIAEGEKDYVKTLKDFYTPFKKAVGAKKDIPKLTNLGEAPKEMECPECDGPMVIKLSRSGKFLSCAKFPDCPGARTMEGEASGTNEGSGEPCPKCDKGKLVERHSRFGKFMACSNYPKCHYVHKDENAEGNLDTGVTCPKCGQGTVTKKRGRFGPFYGCSAYPKCKYTSKNLPEE